MVTQRAYFFGLIGILLLGLVIFSGTVLAAWECPSSPGSSYTDLNLCNTACSPQSCRCFGDNCNRFADEAPYPHGVLPPKDAAPVNSVGRFLWTLTSIIELAQVVFWILTVGFGLYGAYLYLFSGGSVEKASAARKVFIYAVVAGILAILSYGIPGFVSSFILGY